jgi:multidrug efflux pump subunit AcrB
MKKLLVYLLIIVVVLISIFLFIGNQTNYFPPTEEGVEIIQFDVAIKSDINRLSTENQLIRTYTYAIDLKYNEVCFKDGEVIVKGNDEDNYLIEIDKLKVNNPFCLNTMDGNIEVILEGLGDSTSVSPAQ